MTARRLAIIAAALLAPLAAPAVAPAEPVKHVLYSAHLEAKGDYYAEDQDGAHVVYKAKWAWEATYPGIHFAGDRAFTTGEANAPEDFAAHLLEPAYGMRDLGDKNECTTSEIDLTAPGRFVEVPYVPNTDPVLALRLLQSAWPDFEGCPAQAAASFSLSGTLWEGKHTYETSFTFPREAIGMGKVVQLIDLPVRGRICPNNIHGGMDWCMLDIEAKLTFTEIDEWVDDDGTPVDQPKPPPPPPPAPEPKPTPEPEPWDPRADAISQAVAQYGRQPVRDVRAEIISDAVQWYVRRVELELGCSGGCKGTAVIRAGGTAPRAVATAASRKVVGRIRFRVPAGAPRKVRLRLPAKARRALRRAGRATRTVTLRPQDGPAATRTLELRRPR